MKVSLSFAIFCFWNALRIVWYSAQGFSLLMLYYEKIRNNDNKDKS